jgi:cobalt-zinc-cadmium efflux system membrane fusion protein
MRRTAVVIALALIACGGKDASESKSEKPAKQEVADGEMCEEHGVLMAICTKHHPKLIPVFKAKGDYCEEHGFPMSVCPVHFPERGGRPATDIAKDKAPADGTKVRLKGQDTARFAGIKLVAAVNRPGGARLEALASVTYDATKWAQLNARAAGVVRSIKVDIGAVVAKGAPIAVIESATVGADRSRLQAAQARVTYAEGNVQREQKLFEQRISAQKDVLAAQQELSQAKGELAALNAAVGVVGPSAGGNSYVLAAPIAGVVTKRNVTIGSMVEMNTGALFEIVDTSSMRAEIEIPEMELHRVRLGQQVTVTVDALPGSEFTGVIDFIAPEVTRETRTAKARATLANPEASLRANMFGNARIALGQTESTVLVPRIAVQRVADVDMVFVTTAPGEYEVKRVKTGVREGGNVEITSGLKSSEQVVTDGSFLLKTETMKGSIGAGCCE